MSRLVIVESPTKANMIARFLGDDYVVLSSMGHVRDLPESGLGVDVDNGFKVTYVVTKPQVLKELRGALRDADEVYLATDEDREGEAISWHLLEELKPRVPVRRMVFHEITNQAIQQAVSNWRDLDYGLVDAQETRRIVDRLFGYPVSQVLWRRVAPRLSAGRVQSVAVRLVVERERERMAFVSADWWDLTAAFSTDPGFNARLVEVGGRRIATGKDFSQSGVLTRDEVVRLDEERARELADGLPRGPFTVQSIEERPYRSSPKAPFITSTLQQEGGRKLRLGARQVMRIAQGLYERGYITYMRTDSTTLSETAIATARAQISELYGADHLHETQRTYVTKSKSAQEAHEAIRPAGESWRRPEDLRGELNRDEVALYDLIWRRTIASQMADARGRTVNVRIAAGEGDDRSLFAASGRTITFPGYLRAYVEGSDDPDADGDDRERALPELREGQVLPLESLDAVGHTTEPPGRYTEPSLVKRLEELGIGRPSTWASIIGTIQERGYVSKRGSALIPSWTAFSVTKLLEGHFAHLVDYEFTARMEDDLDQIAVHRREREPWLHQFWFGNGKPGLHRLTTDQLDEIDPVAVNSIPLGTDDQGRPVVVRVGRYGPYLQRGDDDRAPVPEGLAPAELTLARAIELLDAPRGEEPIGHDPDSGLPVYAKPGRFGPYVQLGDADTLPEGEKPKTASLLSSMALETITFSQALKLLSLPRVVGVRPEDGAEITVQNGRYGPFLKAGSDTRTLDSEDDLFTLTFDQALELLARPKYGPGSQRTKPPLKELGDDPATGRAMVVKDGRFGPYVTDGETNASLRAGDDVESLTPERAAELLAERRAAGPAKRGGKKATKKKAAKKTTKAQKGSTARKASGTKASAAAGEAPKAEAKKTPAKKRGGTKKSATKKGADTTRPAGAEDQTGQG